MDDLKTTTDVPYFIIQQYSVLKKQYYVEWVVNAREFFFVSESLCSFALNVCVCTGVILNTMQGGRSRCVYYCLDDGIYCEDILSSC